MELRTRDLSKAYSSQVALQEVSLDLSPGITALLGPNGSGKTTLLRCLATLTRPDRGQIWFDGLPYARHLALLRAQTGYLPQDLDLPEGLTPRRLLEYLAALKGAPDAGQVQRLLSALRLERAAEQPFAKLGGGQKRLTGIAQAFLGSPRLLLLDELTRGLDVQERERVAALIRNQPDERLALFSTHEPGVVERLAERVIVLRQGRVVFSGEVEALRREARGAVFQVIAPEGSQPPGVVTARWESGTRGGATWRVLGKPLDGFAATPVEPTLEEAYLWLFKDLPQTFLELN